MIPRNARLQPITWRKAAKYTRRHVYLEHHGDYLQVTSVRPWGKDIRVTVADGRQWTISSKTQFYTRRVK